MHSATQSDVDNQFGYFYAGSVIALLAMLIINRYNRAKQSVLFYYLPAVAFVASPFLGLYVNFPYVANVTVKTKSVADVQMKDLTATERAKLRPGDAYILAELSLKALNSPLEVDKIDFRLRLFAGGEIAYGEALRSERDRGWCKTLASQTLPEGGTLTCWAAFRVPADAASGRLEFTNLRVSDRTRIRF